MTNTSFSLENKVAIVTGGSKGIGRAIALALADSGANVVVAARGADELNSACEEIKAQGRQVLAVPTDVASVADLEHLAKKKGTDLFSSQARLKR